MWSTDTMNITYYVALDSQIEKKVSLYMTDGLETQVWLCYPSAIISYLTTTDFKFRSCVLNNSFLCVSMSHELWIQICFCSCLGKLKENLLSRKANVLCNVSTAKALFHCKLAGCMQSLEYISSFKVSLLIISCYTLRSNTLCGVTWKMLWHLYKIKKNANIL
jgi:hypothetical protein